MGDYSPTEIMDMAMILGESGGNYAAAAALYAVRFPNRRHPVKNTIQHLIARARNGHLARERSHHQYDVYDNRVVVILGMVHINPHVSASQIERQVGIPKQTALRILRKCKYHAYHITLTQALTPADFIARVQFCQWALQRIQQDHDFFKYVLFSDEATFKNDGTLNRHNCHYWSNENPHWFRSIDRQHQWSLMVWCGILNGHLVGPFFFEGNVTGQSFLEMLENRLPTLLEDVDLATRQRMWFQLDGAPPHFSLIVRNFLNNRYANKWIGRGGPIAWPPRSPDLTSPDFFLWGFLKNVVYERAPTTRADMIVRIRNACERIPRNVLLSTVTHFGKRVNACLQVNGEQFEQLLNS